MWCTQRYEVAAAVEVDTTRIGDEFTVAAAVSHARRGEAAPVAAEPVAAVVICKSVDAKASCIEFGSATVVAEGVGEVVRGLGAFRPADVAALAAAVRAIGSVVLGIDAVVVEGAVFGTVDDSVVAGAGSVSCKIRKRAVDAVGAVAVVARGSAFGIAIVPSFITWTMRAVVVAATAIDAAGVGATGATACNVIGGAVVGE
jgi:hypothetical protein